MAASPSFPSTEDDLGFGQRPFYRGSCRARHCAVQHFHRRYQGAGDRGCGARTRGHSEGAPMSLAGNHVMGVAPLPAAILWGCVRHMPEWSRVQAAPLCFGQTSWACHVQPSNRCRFFLWIADGRDFQVPPKHRPRQENPDADCFPGDRSRGGLHLVQVEVIGGLQIGDEQTQWVGADQRFAGRAFKQGFVCLSRSKSEAG